MACERFDIGKLVRGFNIFSGPNFGKLIYYLVIVSLALGVFYVLFIRPTQRTTQNQEAECITNNTTTINQSESGLELQIFPPKLQIGGLKFKLFREAPLTK